ncbi:MAG: NADH-quinone oxidoreductase subunit L [Deltaproteobacteria bacterium]|nr:NADH-quinone oxidoreductase subunit L [Deltaproteobacteria bacterium]
MTDTSLQFAGIPLVAWVAALPLLGAFINLLFGRAMSRSMVHVVAVASVAAAFGVAAYLVFGPLLTQFRAHEGEGGVEISRTLWTWIEVGPADSVFKVDLAFRLDTLSGVMVLIITGVGTLIHLYSTGYMSEEPRYAAYFGYLNLFTGAMLILVLGANLPVMFIGWEGVGLCSFLLIGFWFENESYATAGRKAFVVNRIGDFAFLLGMFLLWWVTKSLDFNDIREVAQQGSSQLTSDPHFMGFDRWATIICVLLFIGACGKSAQVPLYVWLPDAMAGPTPVSALIHAATMVTAGVYMVCRLSFLFSLSTTAMLIVATVGTITALAAAFMAFAQTDLKKVLAYSTVSQLGFMFVAAGTGNWVAAIFHLGTHAFFKAGLFLGAGSVMHGMNGSGDITRMGGLRKHMKTTRATFLIYCLAIAGIFPFAGFFSKDEILGGAWAAHLEGWGAYGKVLFVALSLAALGTAFYMWRLYFLVFSGEERSEDAKHAHESPWTMTVPLVVLAALTAVAGFLAFPHLHSLDSKYLHLLSGWLEPAVDGATEAHNADGTTYLLLAIALGIGALGIGIAYSLYGRGPSAKVAGWTAEGEPLHEAYEASKNKLWVDEIYEVIFLKPFRFLARFLFEFVDRFVIDTILVGGWAFLVGLFSRLMRWVQNGQVQRYIVGMVVGAAAIFFFVSRGHSPTFSYKEVPAGVELRAEPGEGLAGVGATYQWDLDGDGQPDRKPGAKPDATDAAAFVSDPVLTVKAGDLAASGVTLWIKPPGGKKAVSVTRAIQFDSPERAAAEGGK